MIKKKIDYAFYVTKHIQQRQNFLHRILAVERGGVKLK